MTPPTALATINSMSVNPLGGLLVGRADIGALGDGLLLAAIGLVPADGDHDEVGRDGDAGAAERGNGDAAVKKARGLAPAVDELHIHRVGAPAAVGLLVDEVGRDGGGDATVKHGGNAVPAHHR